MADELAPRAVDALAGRPAAAVACGARHTVWVLSDGSAWSCGEGRDGRLGHGGEHSADRPARIAGLRDVTAAACGDAHTACVTMGRRLYTFGSGTCGQLGYPAGGAAGGGRGGGGAGRISTLGRGGDGVWHGSLAREVAALGPDREAGGVRDVACGGTCTLAVGWDKGLWVWGAGPVVQALTGIEAAVVVPVRPARLAGDFVSKLACACGGGHALAVLTKYAPPEVDGGPQHADSDAQLSAAG